MPISRADPTTDHAPDEVTPHDARSLRLDTPEASETTTDHNDSSAPTGAAPELRHERFRIGDKLQPMSCSVGLSQALASRSAPRR
jgi:hypothetical protein